MASPIVPKKVSERHRLMILLAAMGKGTSEIAREVDVTPQWASTVLNAPRFKLQVKHLQDQIEQESLGTFVDRLNAEAEPTLDRIIDLRDNSKLDQVQLGAARTIFNKIVPDISRNEEERTLKLVVEGVDLASLANAIAEDEGKTIDVTEYQRVRSADNGPVRAKMPEEMED